MTGPPFSNWEPPYPATPWPYEVVAPDRSPWAPAPPLRFHEARTVIVYDPGILRAADAPPRR